MLKITSMYLKTTCLLLFAMIILGCGQEEKNLKNRSAQLDSLQDSLTAKQHELHLKEVELMKREQVLDSSSVMDTASVFNQDLAGKWQVRMTCVETTCEGSAIGDVRNEQWNISFKNDVVIIQAVSNGKVHRLYTGLYNGRELQLVSNSSEVETTIKVTLNPKTANKMAGKREIRQAGNCVIIYSLDLDKT
jgi:hypothetical protein